MKNKLLFSTFLALFCAFIIGCGSNSSQKGANIFNGKLDSVKKINYVLPDETVKTIDNKEDVKLICDILSNQVYSEVDNSSQIEGFHLLEMVGDETFEITLIRNLVSFNGKEYEAGDKEAFNTIYDTIREDE